MSTVLVFNGVNGINQAIMSLSKHNKRYKLQQKLKQNQRHIRKAEKLKMKRLENAKHHARKKVARLRVAEE